MSDAELDWRPRADLSALRARAVLYGQIRQFFARAGVLEVETPILSRAATPDPAIESLRTSVQSFGTCWLHSSPEFAMKRLLAAGSGPIYQICKVFRDGERGSLHHPEFSLLEWYRPGWSLEALMEEVADLVRVVLGRSLPQEIRTYRELFQKGLGLDPFATNAESLAACAHRQGILDAERLELDRDGWLDLLLSHCIAPDLGRDCLTFVRDYPPSQAALARIRPSTPPVAERFELYFQGKELANGFWELTDAEEQRRRFQAELEERRAAGRTTPPLDEAFLAALPAMPEASGVALGLDRLLLCKLGCSHLDAVLAFPLSRA